MPILDIINAPLCLIVQRCALCETVNTIPAKDLVLGDAIDRNTIRLPACGCGATESFARTFDVIPDGLAAHRKKVNALAAALKGFGHIHPKQKESVENETVVPTQVGEPIGLTP